MPDKIEPEETGRVPEPHPFEAVPVAPGVSKLVPVRNPYPDGSTLVSVKRYANGKYFLYASASRRHMRAVAQALEASAEIRLSFDHAGFAARLEAAGLGPDDAHATIESLQYIDEVYSLDRWRR